MYEKAPDDDINQSMAESIKLNIESSTPDHNLQQSVSQTQVIQNKIIEVKSQLSKEKKLNEEIAS